MKNKEVCMGKFTKDDLGKFEVIEFCGEKYYKNKETNETFEYNEWDNQFLLCPIEKKNLKDFLENYETKDTFLLSYTYDSKSKTFTTATRISDKHYKLTKDFAKSLVIDYFDEEEVNEDEPDPRMINALRQISTAINGNPTNKNVVKVFTANKPSDEETPYVVTSYACRDSARLDKILKHKTLKQKFKEGDQEIYYIDGWGDGGSDNAVYFVKLTASEIETIKNDINAYNDKIKNSNSCREGLDEVTISDGFTVLSHLFDYNIFNDSELSEEDTKKFLGVDKPSKSDINLALNFLDSSVEEALKSSPDILENVLDSYTEFTKEYNIKPQFTHFQYKKHYDVVIIQDTKNNETYLYLDHFNSEAQVIKLAVADSSQKDAVKINNDYYVIA